VRAEVLATVAHDLKSPLGTIKGLAQLLQRQVTGAEPVAAPDLVEKLGRIDAAATRMARLIDELLDVARLEAGQPLRLARRPNDLVALVQQVVTEHQARSPAHDVRVEAGQAELVGLWDAFRLDRVVDNLLGNAVKYSPPGRPICVRVWQEQDEAVVEVVDQGVGIPAAALPHLFERFHRASNVGTTPGTGLGLVGVRRIVEEHGGSISIRSQEGEGTTVSIRLPLGAVETGTPHGQNRGAEDKR
jgi:signal transduction histidine kinase